MIGVFKYSINVKQDTLCLKYYGVAKDFYANGIKNAVFTVDILF